MGRATVGDIFLSCLQCGTCTGACPWNLEASYNPRRILRELSLNCGSDRSVDQAVWSCVTCNACGVVCPRGIMIVDVMQAVRALNVSTGKTPGYFKMPLDSLTQSGNPWGGERTNRLQWAEGLDIPGFVPEHDYCLFTCCTTAYDPDSRQAGRAFARLLQTAAVSFGTLGSRETCCGDPAHKMGATDGFAGLVRKNSESLLKAGVHKLLTTSPHCLDAFKNHYPALKDAVASEHYTQLLDRLVARGRLRPVGQVDRIVTFHDPCYLGRHNGIFEAPRRILQSIPGLKLVEMPNNRQGSVCCGGGGGGAWSKDALDQNFSVLRVQEALGTGAEVIATACPYCIRMLNAAVGELGVEDQIVVRDLAELLWQSVSSGDDIKPAEHAEPGLEQEVCHV
ncbi:MAG: hypothetical protein BZ151_13060 [Desulfobacca sp. 4484_104]|nr:MAG: hypothetical protein BZ151_13060 [Desulfobacca sp. 4484_104]